MPVEQAGNGYALWLEPAHLHFHHGDSARIKVLWGYAMKREKLDGPVNCTALVKEPGGREFQVPVAADRDGFSYEMAFAGGPEGIYTVQVEYQAGKNHHWARVLVPFGHHIRGRGEALNRGLEIVPGDYGHFHPGDAVLLTVLFNGQPLAGARLLATYHIYDGDGFPHELVADEIGTLKFVFDARGHWMLQAHAVQETDRHVATLVIPGVR
ncbi:MAG: DUF4198 domain-containing protein [Firmicutes bacterium]|nr:DUF4198 domain-containing protein [Bacillota bacterium]